MRIAYEEAARALSAGSTKAEAVAARKPRVAFAGSMRKNLVAMMDALGIPALMGVVSSADLFESDELRTGSVLKYPVFKNEKNYTGHSPAPVRHPALKEMVDSVLAEELAVNSNCLILPLGKAVEEVLDYSAAQGRLDLNRVLRGFPHPSGANGHRNKQFSQNRAALKSQVEKWFG